MQVYRFEPTFQPLPQLGGLSCGFPSPADDYLDEPIDLNRECIKNKSATFFGRVSGDSMKDAGLNDGDLLIIDRSIKPYNNAIAVCFIDGEFTVKRLLMEQDVIYLQPENSSYKPLKVTKDNDFMVWGIVRSAVKHF